MNRKIKLYRGNWEFEWIGDVYETGGGVVSETDLNIPWFVDGGMHVGDDYQANIPPYNPGLWHVHVFVFGESFLYKHVF